METNQISPEDRDREKEINHFAIEFYLRDCNNKHLLPEAYTPWNRLEPKIKQTYIDEAKTFLRHYLEFSART